MNIPGIVSAVTKTLVILIFWTVLALSAFLEEQITPEVLLFILAKSLLVSGVAWVLLVIVNDTLVRSMADSALEKNANRFKGGISYHLVNPTAEERAWQEQHRMEENEALGGDHK